MKRASIAAAVALGSWAAQACVGERAEDGAPPLVAITFLRAAGTPTVRSTEDPRTAPDDCVYASGPAPWRVLVTVTDPGGIRDFGVRVPLGNAVVDAFAPGPGASASVVAAGAGENVTVTLEPRAGGLVQRRADVTVDVSGPLPLDVRGWGRDLANNYAETQQFTLEDADGATICGSPPEP